MTAADIQTALRTAHRNRQAARTPDDIRGGNDVLRALRAMAREAIRIESASGAVPTRSCIYCGHVAAPQAFERDGDDLFCCRDALACEERILVKARPA